MVKSQNISPEQTSYSVLVLFAILFTEEFKIKNKSVWVLSILFSTGINNFQKVL